MLHAPIVIRNQPEIFMITLRLAILPLVLPEESQEPAGNFEAGNMAIGTAIGII